MSKPNIIYISSGESSFIRKDLSFLRERYEVKTQFYVWTNKIWVPFFLIKQLFDLLIRSNSKTVYIVMFAGFWSVIPVWLGKIYRRKTYVIVGGTDCVSFPELNYGALRKSMQRKTIQYSLNNCTTIVPVAEQLIESDYTYVDYQHKKQGYKSFFPKIQTPVRVIYNGFSVSSSNENLEKTKGSFITVARIENEVTYKLKGIDLIVDAAKANPSLKFTVVGISGEMIERFSLSKIPNLSCHSFMKHEELKAIYVAHEFYLCLSISEGFPNALCEGMSHGCIPVGSNVSSIPFIIESTGFVLEKRDFAMLQDLLVQTENLSLDELQQKAESAKDRIANTFSLERRKKAFYELIG